MKEVIPDADQGLGQRRLRGDAAPVARARLLARRISDIALGLGKKFKFAQTNYWK
jgi:hypothetical protein